MAAPLDAFHDPAASEGDAGKPVDTDPDDLPGETAVTDGGMPPAMHGSDDAGAPADGGAAALDAGTDDVDQSFAIDPAKVYLLGTLAQDASQPVLCDPFMPNVVMSFPAYDKKLPPVISPFTRDVYYADLTHHLHRVRPTSTDVSDDSLVSTAACADESGPVKLDYIAFDPEGVLYFACRNAVYDENGNAFPRCAEGDDKTPLAMGKDGTMLCSQHILINGAAFALQDAKGASIDLHDGVARARDGGGFWFVRANKNHYERWSVSDQGIATLDGSYADAPDQWKPENPDEKGIVEIDGSGALYRWGHSLGAQDQIAFFSADFAHSQVSYDEAGEPRCKFDASTLITGP